MANSLDIADDDLLYRRLPPDRIRPDGTVTSLAYKLHGKPDTSISVEIARLASVEECLSRSPQAGVRIGMIAASSARELGFSVRHDPLPANYAHALIEGSNTKDLMSQTGTSDKTRTVASTDQGGVLYPNGSVKH